MALNKTNVVEMITNATITAGGTAVSASSIDLSGVISLEIFFIGTFNASTTAGAKVEMFSNPINATFTIGANDEPIDAMDVLLVAGVTKTKPGNFKCCSKYAKIRVTNIGSQSMTNVSIYAVQQTQ